MANQQTPEPSSGRERPLTTAEQAAAERRRETRFQAGYRATTATIDPVHNPVTRRSCYQTSEDDQVTNVSRRGVCLVSAQPPGLGTRLLVQIHLSGAARPVEIVGRACWTRVCFERGDHGARPLCEVGVELLGGSADSLDRYDRSIAERSAGLGFSVAAPRGLV